MPAPVAISSFALHSSLEADKRELLSHVAAGIGVLSRMAATAELLALQTTWRAAEPVPDFLSVTEVAARLSVSKTEVRALIRRSELTARYLDRRLLVVGESYVQLRERLRTAGVH